MARKFMNDVIFRETVAELCDALSREEEEVAILLVEGFSDEEIAVLLGIRPGAVRQRLTRARRRIARRVPAARELLRGRKRGKRRR